MNKIKLTAWLILVVACAVSAQDRAYFETQFIAGFGNGNMSSGLLYTGYDFDIEDQDYGIGLESYNPISKNYSVIFSSYFLHSRIETKGIARRQWLNRYGFKVGLRWYL